MSNDEYDPESPSTTINNYVSVSELNVNPPQYEPLDDTEQGTLPSENDTKTTTRKRSLFDR